MDCTEELDLQFSIYKQNLDVLKEANESVPKLKHAIALLFDEVKQLKEKLEKPNGQNFGTNTISNGKKKARLPSKKSKPKKRVNKKIPSLKKWFLISGQILT